MSISPVTDTGDTGSNFRADREKQVTQTVGVNPVAPANRSESVPSDTSPLATQIANGDCIIGPYSGFC